MDKLKNIFLKIKAFCLKYYTVIYEAIKLFIKK